ncbi:MAG: hypothetical protein CV088_10500 [Nitrospira sp. LK70]|nr:hypothetical protein [Nitrospira sp. LK70]
MERTKGKAKAETERATAKGKEMTKKQSKHRPVHSSFSKMPPHDDGVTIALAFILSACAGGPVGSKAEKLAVL